MADKKTQTYLVETDKGSYEIEVEAPDATPEEPQPQLRSRTGQLYTPPPTGSGRAFAKAATDSLLDTVNPKTYIRLGQRVFTDPAGLAKDVVMSPVNAIGGLVTNPAETLGTLTGGVAAGNLINAGYEPGMAKGGRALETLGSRKNAVPMAVGSGIGAGLATGNPMRVLEGAAAGLLPSNMVRLGQWMQKKVGKFTLEDENVMEGLQGDYEHAQETAHTKFLDEQAEREATMRKELEAEQKRVDAETAQRKADESAFARNVNQSMRRNVGDVIRVGSRNLAGGLSELDKNIAQVKAEAAGTRAASQRAEDIAIRSEERADMENLRDQQRATRDRQRQQAKEERARRIQEERDAAGLVPGKKRYSESTSGTTPEGVRVSSSQSFKEPDVAGAAVDPMQQKVDALMAQNKGMPEALARRIIEAQAGGATSLQPGQVAGPQRPMIRVQETPPVAPAAPPAPVAASPVPTATPAPAPVLSPVAGPERPPIRTGTDPAITGYGGSSVPSKSKVQSTIPGLSVNDVRELADIYDKMPNATEDEIRAELAKRRASRHATKYANAQADKAAREAPSREREPQPSQPAAPPDKAARAAEIQQTEGMSAKRAKRAANAEAREQKNIDEYNAKQSAKKKESASTGPKYPEGRIVRFSGNSVDGKIVGGDMDVKVVNPHSNASKVTGTTGSGRNFRQYEGANRHLPTVTVEDLDGRQFEVYEHQLKK